LTCWRADAEASTTWEDERCEALASALVAVASRCDNLAYTLMTGKSLVEMVK
jgi:hypothetical protein